MKPSVQFVLFRLLFSAVVFGCATGAAQDISPELMLERVKIKHAKIPKKVLAFYYGWYGNPTVSGRWFHWAGVNDAEHRISNSTFYPQLGAYDTHDPKVVEQHCRWARDAGIDGFIATWWQPKDFHDKGLPLLLETAEKFDLDVTVYFETVPNSKPEKALQDVLYILENYGSHPAWLKVEGKPVIFVYGRALGQIGPNGWLWVTVEANRRYPKGAVFIGDRLSKRTARIFDGIHTYNITGATEGKTPEEIRAVVRKGFAKVKETPAGRILCFTIIPGYDDSKLGRGDPRPVTERHEGRTYRVLWEEAVAANPDWVLITSWNEWHEGSQIEPSFEFGDRELKTTAEFAPKFKALPRRSPAAKAGPSAVSDEERASLREAFRDVPVAVLPDADSEALWFLLNMGVMPTMLKWEQAADETFLDPKRFPIVLYASGEKYQPTARDENDVLKALQRYVRSGGVLAVMPSQPMPFHYGAERKTVAHWRDLRMPLSIAWERPPEGTPLTFVVCDRRTLPHVPERFVFPSAGDLRWRPLLREQAAEGVSLKPLIELRDDRGKSLGLGAGIIGLERGAVIYAWFRLLEMPEGEGLLYDLWTLAVNRRSATK